MKRVPVVVVLAAAMLVAPVVAQEDQSVAPETRAQERTSRIDAYKERASERLSTAQKNRVTARCKSAQAKIAKLQVSDKSKTDKRTEKYGNISEKVTTIVSRLQAAGADTSKLEIVIEDMQSKLAESSTAISEYSVALTDLVEMDCQSDADAFQATLSVVRQLRGKLQAQSKSFQSLLTEKIKTALQATREVLAITREES